MRCIRSWALLPIWLGVAACATPRHAEFSDLLPAPAGAPADTMAADEAAIAEHPTLAAIVRVALARNPELAAARARAEAAFAAVPGAGQLPDPELQLQLMGAPLARPWALGDADAVSVGLRQAFPAPGVRGADTRAAEEDARAAVAMLHAVELDVVRDAELAWAAYVLAARATVIHDEHIAVASSLVGVAGSLIASGRVSQDDVLQLDLERSRLHQDIARLEREQRTTAVQLNRLMGRAIDAPLGAPPTDDDGVLARSVPPLHEALAQAVAQRPELAALGHRVRARQAEVDARRGEARWPSIMIGADYWLMPAMDEHGYGLMLSLNLPWLWGGRDDRRRAAEAGARGEAREVDAMRARIQGEVGEAHATLLAARRELELLDTEVLPRAQRAFESARGRFASGGGSTLALLDTMRSLLDVRLEQAEARIAISVAWTGLDRALGTELTP